MRMMLKAVFDTEAANETAGPGLYETIKEMVAQLNPEAAYFAPDDGQRSCLFVFDMADTSQMPAIAEPLFLRARARVTLTPCMNLEDLEKGFVQAFPQSGQSTA